MVAVAVVGFVVPVAIALHYRAIGAPSADDWAYDLAVYRLAFHGHLYLYHWARINLVGQILLGVPVVWLFGEHAWALNGLTCVMGCAGLLSICYLGRRLGLPRWAALLAACALGLGPMWSATSTSFMTDIPSLAVMSMALAVAASDGRTDRLATRRSVLALLIAAFAFTIRDEAGAVFAVIALCRLGRCRRTDWRRARGWVMAVVIIGVAMAAFYLWRLGLPSGGGTSNKAVSTFAGWWDDSWLFPLGGLMLAPVAAVLRPWRTVSSAWRQARLYTVIGWAVMPVGPVLVYLLRSSAIIGSGQSLGVKLAELAPPFGNFYFAGGGFSPAGGPVIPGWLAFSLACVSVASVAVVVATLAQAAPRWVKHRDQPAVDDPVEQSSYVASLLMMATIGQAAVFVALVEMQLVTWDRYLLRLVPYLGLLLLYLRRRSADSGPDSLSWRRGWGVMAAVAALSVVMTIAIDGFIGSEWNYSQHFAATVPATPPARIFTDWTWSSTQNAWMVNPFAANLSPWYVPCYLEVYDSTDTQGVIYVRRGGSWAQSTTYAMARNPKAGADPSCHF